MESLLSIRAKYNVSSGLEEMGSLQLEGMPPLVSHTEAYLLPGDLNPNGSVQSISASTNDRTQFTRYQTPPRAGPKSTPRKRLNKARRQSQRTVTFAPARALEGSQVTNQEEMKKIKLRIKLPTINLPPIPLNLTVPSAATQSPPSVVSHPPLPPLPEERIKRH